MRKKYFKKIWKILVTNILKALLRFAIDSAHKSESVDSNSIKRLYKKTLFLKIIELINQKPELLQEQLKNEEGISDFTMKKYRNDRKTDSVFWNKTPEKNSRRLLWTASNMKRHSFTTEKSVSNEKNLTKIVTKFRYGL